MKIKSTKRILAFILAAVILLTGMPALMAEAGELAGAGEQTFYTSPFTVTDARDASRSAVVNPNDNRPAVYLFGRYYGCPKIRKTLEQISEMTEGMNEDLNIFGFDIDGMRIDLTEELLVAGLSGYDISDKPMIIYNTPEIDSFKSECLRLCGVKSYTFPFVVYKNANNEIVTFTTDLQDKSVIKANMIQSGYNMPDTSVKSLGVVYHTQEEIKEYLKKSGAKITDAINYDIKPVVTGAGSLGKVNDATQDSAIKMLNQIRYVAGVSANVIADDRYIQLTQAAAVVNAANNGLSHSPSKPAGMDNTLYELGRKGAGESNIAFAPTTYTLNAMLLKLWVGDSDSNNISVLGHRRWCLNPTMGKTGFGVAPKGTYNFSAMYSFDRSGTNTVKRVAWPAQNMPVDYFASGDAWSVSIGENVADAKVTLTDTKTNKVWSFSKSKSDGFFNIENNGYGQIGCIIFRPGNSGYTYKAGDKFDVTIEYVTGYDATNDDNRYTLKYTVEFFDASNSGSKPTPTPTPEPEPEVVKYCTVTFEDGEGNVISTVKEVVVGKALDSGKYPANPVKEGYNFKGWANKANTFQIIYPQTRIDGDITLIPVWEAQKKLSVPKFSVKYPVVPAGTRLEIASDDANAQIYYKIYDVSSAEYDNHNDFKLYREPVTISANMVIRAYAEAEGYITSEDVSFTYFIDTDANVSENTISANALDLGDVLMQDVTAKGIPDGIWIAGLDKEYKYTGKAIKPGIRVYCGNRLLVEKKDYTLTYKNNVKVKAAGKYDNAAQAVADKAPYIMITGKGNYKDKTYATFSITAVDMNDRNVIAEDVVVPYAEGKAIVPSPVITAYGTRLRLNKDFTVRNPDGSAAAYAKPGVYTAIIKADENSYTSFREIKVYVTKKKPANKITFSIPSMEYTGEPVVPKDGVIATYEGRTLTEGTDYELKYYNNTTSGRAYAVLTGKGAYEGTKTVSFMIEKPYESGKYNIYKDEYQVMEYRYDEKVDFLKSGAKPDVKVLLDGEYLKEGIDYTVKYLNNKLVSTPTVKAAIQITGKGNYTGTVYKEFIIDKTSLKNCTAVAYDKVYNSRAKGYITKFVIYDREGKPLSAGKDYDKAVIYSYKNRTTVRDLEGNDVVRQAGEQVADTDIIPMGTTLQISVNSMGYYKDDVKLEYKLIEKSQDISSAKVTPQVYTYSGKSTDIRPSDFKLESKTGPLKPADYEIAGVMNAINKGNATVIIRGRGTYGGVKLVKCKINPMSICE